MKKNLEETSVVAMNIISSVSSAKQKIEEAIILMANKDFSTALQKIEEGESFISQAHHFQTNYIQETIAEEDNIVPMLMVHAQDILMSGTDELRMLKTLIRIFGDHYEK